jgi:opacity protein-like surface antigen
MKTLKIFLLSIICLVYAASAGGQVKPLIIHPAIGNKIDKQNNTKYEFFLNHSDLDSVLFFRQSDGKIFAKAYFADNKPYESELNYNLENIARYIMKIRNGSYGNVNLLKSITIDSSGCCYTVKLIEIRDELPHVKKYHPEENTEYTFSFGADFNFYSPDFSSLSDFYGKIQNALESQGYRQRLSIPDVNINSFYNLKYGIRLGSGVWINLSAGKGINSDLSVWQVFGFLNYRHDFKNFKWIKPYGGLGFGIFNYEIETNYGSGNTIDFITCNGSKSGFIFNAGLDIMLVNNEILAFAFNADFKYSLQNKLDASTTSNGNITSENLPTSINLNKLSFSFGVKIFY